MSIVEIFVYCIQFVALSYWVLYFRGYRNTSFLGRHGRYGIFLITVSFGLVHSLSSIFYFKADVLSYLSRSKVLYNYICSDFIRNIDILLYPGGAFVPQKHSWVAYELDHWIHTSSLLIIKIYAFFGAISCFHLVNISLWFSFMAFHGYYCSFIMLDRFRLPRFSQFIWLGLPFVLFLDSVFLFGIHKESIAFFLILILLSVYLSPLTKKNIFIAILAFVFLSLIRNTVAFNLAIGILFGRALFNLKDFKWAKFFLLIFVSALLSSLPFGVSQFIVYTWNRFQQNCKGNFGLEPIEFPHTILQKLIFGPKILARCLIYFPKNQGAVQLITCLESLFFWSIVLYLAIQIFRKVLTEKPSALFYRIMYIFYLPSMLNLGVIGITVCNFGTILRYRSLSVFLLLFGMLLMAYSPKIYKKIETKI